MTTPEVDVRLGLVVVGAEAGPVSVDGPLEDPTIGGWNDLGHLGLDHDVIVDETTTVRGVATWSDVAGDYLVFAPAGCLLTADAPEAIRELIRHNPDVEFAYFDSSGYDPSRPGHFADPHHRPGFSPERLRAQHYIGPVFLVARTVAEAFDPDGIELAQPLTRSVASALTARCLAVAHIPRVLYRTPAPVPSPAGDAVAAIDRDEGVIDLELPLSVQPLVSIVIPTNGAQREIDGRPTVLCLQAIDSIIATTTYPTYEVVLVVTPGGPHDLVAQVLSTVDRHPPGRQPTVRFCRDDRPFNFSNACNRGAVAAAGELLVFLNDDTAVEAPGWLDRLVATATRTDIGAVGAKLLYGDGTIQHVGIWSRGGHPTHRYERFPAEHPGYLDSLLVPQNCLAVTGACLAVTADKFREAGGFSPVFPSSYNDVDLCLKLADLGYRTVVDPTVVLTHYEASSRDPSIDEHELAALHERWRSVIIDDPYDNPNHLAPGADEYPPPDAMVTERLRAAGRADHLPRVWPRQPLTAASAEATADPEPAIAGSIPC